jgi:hypothetical protein
MGFGLAGYMTDFHCTHVTAAAVLHREPGNLFDLWTQPGINLSQSLG